MLQFVVGIPNINIYRIDSKIRFHSKILRKSEHLGNMENKSFFDVLTDQLETEQSAVEEEIHNIPATITNESGKCYFQTESLYQSI